MKKILIIFLCLGFFAVLPSLLQSLTAYAVLGGLGGACMNGWTGTCLDHNNPGSCGGTWVQGSPPWPCPNGGNSIWCCVPPPPAPPPPTSVNFSCVPAGTSDTATVSWTLPGGYSYAYPRIYDKTTGATFYPAQMTGNSYSINTAVPGHVYSWWVHTTNSAGSPYSTEVPYPALSASYTCPMPTCGDATSPTGSALSTGVLTSASTIYQNNASLYGPANAVDGVMDLNKYWNSGTNTTPQWIEINLGAQEEVTGLKLYVRQAPDGVTTHQILTGLAPNPQTNSRTLSCYTSDNQVINVVFPTPIATQYLRINTTTSSSWVAWNEVTVFGTAPGVQTDTPGIVYSGDQSSDFGQAGGRASVNDWTVGGLIYPEVYPTATNQTTTSYKYMHDKIVHAGIAIKEMTTLAGCASLSNCTLPNGLPNGVYHAGGDVTLNAFAFPADKNFVFLIDGNLTIKGNIIVPNRSTAFFTSSNNIVIDRSVGTATNLFPLPAGQVQGIFSADHDFLLDGINNCAIGKDKMLNIEGNIITNASGQGGHFRHPRDLCGDNPKIPTFTIRLRLDFILNAPAILSRQNTTLREENP